MSELDEVNSIVNESGNSFHCRVANYLKEKGWSTLVSPYYMDGATNKPREIDLVAEKSWKYEDRIYQKYGYVNIKLFIECKYIPQINVFWLGAKDMNAAKNWVTSNTPLPENNIYTDMHHYLSSNKLVAKLFASKQKQSVENEVIYKALNQSLNAMVYLRGRDSLIPQKNHRMNVSETLEIPVILCNNFEKLYSVEMEDIGAPKKLSDSFQLEVNYAYINKNNSHVNEYFLIDVVDFEKIDSFLAVLENDIKAIFNIL